jgi:hypothetical protein
VGRVAIRDQERRHVLHDFRATADDRVRANAAKLMHRAQAADDGMIAHDDMSRQSGVVGENRLVPDYAIVRDVRVGEEEITVADDRFLAGTRAAMDGGKFAEGVALADFEMGRLALVFQVLRLEADGRVRKKFIPRANFARPFDRRVMTDLAALAQFNVRADDGVGSDLHAAAETGFGINDGGGMNLRFGHGLRQQSITKLPNERQGKFRTESGRGY